MSDIDSMRSDSKRKISEKDEKHKRSGSSSKDRESSSDKSRNNYSKARRTSNLDSVRYDDRRKISETDEKSNDLKSDRSRQENVSEAKSDESKKREFLEKYNYDYSGRSKHNTKSISQKSNSTSKKYDHSKSKKLELDKFKKPSKDSNGSKKSSSKDVGRKLDIRKSSDRRELRRECRQRKYSIPLKKLNEKEIRRWEEGRIPSKFKIPKDYKRIEKRSLINTGEDKFSQQLSSISSKPLAKFKIPKKVEPKNFEEKIKSNYKVELNANVEKEIKSNYRFAERRLDLESAQNDKVQPKLKGILKNTNQNSVSFSSTDSTHAPTFKIPKIPQRNASSNLTERLLEIANSNPTIKPKQNSLNQLRNRKNLGEYMQERHAMQHSKFYRFTFFSQYKYICSYNVERQSFEVSAL